MERTWKILFVDDDHRYAKPLIERAYEYSLELEHYDNWEEAYSQLIEEFDTYHAVIIDGKGKLNKDSRGDDQKHVSKAIGDLRELKGNRQYIPFVILSKYLEIKDAIVEPFFEKNKDEEKLFEFLIKEIQNLDDNKIRIKYKDAFKAFDEGYLAKSAKENLLEAIRSFENNTCNDNSFAPLRKIIEAIYQNIHEKDDELIPYGCLRFENNKINFGWCERRLRGLIINDRNTREIIYPKSKSVLPEYLGLGIGVFTNLCNNAMHIGYKEYITKNTLGSCLYFIIDLLIWYKNFVDENYLS
jgi:hypothetical protein